MTLSRCADCSTAFAVGLSACPHCQGTNYAEDGEMPKVTLHGGPSDKRLMGTGEPQDPMNGDAVTSSDDANEPENATTVETPAIPENTEGTRSGGSISDPASDPVVNPTSNEQKPATKAASSKAASK